MNLPLISEHIFSKLHKFWPHFILKGFPVEPSQEISYFTDSSDPFHDLGMSGPSYSVPALTTEASLTKDSSGSTQRAVHRTPQPSFLPTVIYKTKQNTKKEPPQFSVHYRKTYLS